MCTMFALSWFVREIPLRAAPAEPAEPTGGDTAPVPAGGRASAN